MLLLTAIVLLLQAVISVHTELVAVPVAVTDRNGEHVGGLTQDNFQIFENGRLQPIAVFDHGDAPVTIGLVVDRSRSMRAKNSSVMTAITALLKTSRPDDELFGVGFGDDVMFGLAASRPFAGSAEELLAAMLAMPIDGRTAFYDGVAAALEHLEAGHAGRKVLIVISDGGDNESVKTSAEVLALARQSGAVIYAIGTMSDDPDTRDEDAGLMKRLCRDTGGVSYFPRTPAAIVDAAERVARDIREHYTIGFVPGTRAAGFHRIDVKVAAPGRARLHVRARTGYVSQP